MPGPSGSQMWKMRLLLLQEDEEAVVAGVCDDDEVADDDVDDGRLEEVDGSIEPGHEDGKGWSLSW